MGAYYYLLYQSAMREQFKVLNPPGMTFGQLAKYSTSAMYSELPPSEKEAWVARAEAEKARYYLHELRNLSAYLLLYQNAMLEQFKIEA
jgi:hypothetical protein